jgi:flavin reductase (DIM6/NTAB) family NADH-FMN oxidoreductase RutF
MILKTGEFNVSILAQGVTFDAFEHFGFQSGKTVDKFAGYEFARRADNGIYYITKNTNAYLSAKVTQTVDCGTHALFIADVMDAKVLSNAVSVTYDDYYKNIKPKPEKTKVKGWRCKICNYVYEGEELPPDYICPLCKHGAEDFEKIE